MRAGTLLAAASIVIWFLQSFDCHLEMLPPDRTGESLLASVGKGIAPVFAPWGLASGRRRWRCCPALWRRRRWWGTLTILYNPASDAAMYAALQSVFTPAAALAFMVFVLLYMPCVAPSPPSGGR